jgi:hypothetical protein
VARDDPPAFATQVTEPIGRLVDQWCTRRELRPLAILLPAWTANGGMTDQWADVLDALIAVRDRGRLPDDERAVVERAIPVLERAVGRR